MIVVYCVHVRVRVLVRACATPLYMRMLWLRAASVRAARRAPAERHEASMEGRALVADLG